VCDIVHFPGSHTAVKIAEILKPVIDEWTIDPAVSVTTDNASNMLNVFEEHLKIPNIRCFAHTLQLVIKDGIEDINPLIKKCRQIV